MKEIIRWSVGSCLLCLCTSAWAQEDAGSQGRATTTPPENSRSSSPAEGALIGDIIVTATRETTLLSKTPVTMTVLDSEQLRDAGISDARALTNAVPNLSITESPSAVRISIRGVTSTDDSEKGDPSAAFLIDGIYIARYENVQSSLYDVERIEVLRGPQGTLYGRNTTAGIVNVLSRRPGSEFEASVDASYASLNTVNVTGVINLPVGDALGFRTAVNYRRQDSYFLVPDGANGLDPAYNTISGRFTFGGKALNDRLDFAIIADISHDSGKNFYGNAVTLDRFYTGTGIPTVDPVYVRRSSKEQRRLLFPPTRDDQEKDFTFYGIAGDFTYDFGPIRLSYLGSYRKSTLKRDADFFLFGAVQNPVVADQDSYQTSHEIRAAFGAGYPLHGQFGVYYFHENNELISVFQPPLAQIVVPGAIGYSFARTPAKATSKAVFGQVTYDVTPEFHLTAGARHTRDTKSRFGDSAAIFPDAATIPAALQSNCDANFRCILSLDIQDAKFSKTTWRIGVDYDVSNLGLVYATVSTGYKAGGFNDGCVIGDGFGCDLTEEQLYYKPETLTSYEAGFKFRFGGGFRLEGAAFHYDYKDLQLSQAVATPRPGLRASNAASAKVDGVELFAVAQLSDNDNFQVSFNWLDARYHDFVPDPIGHPTLNFRGRPLNHAPDFSAMLAYIHTVPLGNDSRIDLGIRSRFSSEYFITDLGNLTFFRQPSFTKTDLTITYSGPGDRFYVQAFARNIENEITVANAISGLVSSVQIQEPRIIGGGIGFKF